MRRFFETSGILKEKVVSKILTTFLITELYNNADQSAIVIIDYLLHRIL